MNEKHRDEPDFNEARYLAPTARLDIPLRSVVNLRRVAGELRALAQALDVLSKEQEKPGLVLLSAAYACRHTGKNLRKIRAPGRPRKY